MTAVLRRSPAKRRGQSTQIMPRDLALLHHESPSTASPTATRPRRKSDTSIVPTVFQLWTPSVSLPNVESSHIFDELVKSEIAFVDELKSIYTTIIRPYRLQHGQSNTPPSSPTKFGSTLNSPKTSRPKKHGRSGSLFSLKFDKETSSTSSDHLTQRLKDPMQPEADHLERAFRSIETMVRSHSGMLSAFLDSRSPHELISAFIVHVESLQLVYRSFVLTLPYISNLLPLANDMLPNKLSGYSRFLGPMQRSIKYELLIRRLANALYKEAGSIELQKLVRTALKTSESFCQTLEAAQKSEQAKIYLVDLSTRLGQDVKHKTLFFEGPITTEALSSKKGCKINYVVLFSDGTVFWNSAASPQERTPKSWAQETITAVEDGGYLDLVVHTLLQKQEKTKAIRRAVGFTLATKASPALITEDSAEKSKRALPALLDVVEARGEKRRRKESIMEEWIDLGRQREKEQKRFSLGSTIVVEGLRVKSPLNEKTGYF